MEFLVLLVFRASVAHVGALGCRACQVAILELVFSFYFRAHAVR
jgi:hypothetical protein